MLACERQTFSIDALADRTRMRVPETDHDRASGERHAVIHERTPGAS